MTPTEPEKTPIPDSADAAEPHLKALEELGYGHGAQLARSWIEARCKPTNVQKIIDSIPPA